jgi:hypothetical protein
MLLQVIIKGGLFGRVRTFESGSYWELIKEKGVPVRCAVACSRSWYKG